MTMTIYVTVNLPDAEMEFTHIGTPDTAVITATRHYPNAESLVLLIPLRTADRE